MVPRVADPAVRTALIEHAARITAEEGRQALTLRRLATEVGASTMAVYTHFGGMEELRQAVRREGFSRLATHLNGVEITGDSVADLLAQGGAYFTNAVTNPHLYRAMFLDGPGATSSDLVGYDTFETLVDAVRRCIEAGRFGPADPYKLADQIWALSHGAVALHLAGLRDTEATIECLSRGARNLILAFGDSPAALARSWRRALDRWSSPLP